MKKLEGTCDPGPKNTSTKGRKLLKHCGGEYYKIIWF